MAAKLVESIHRDVKSICQTKVGAQVEARRCLLREIGGREGAKRCAPCSAIVVADNHITVRNIPCRKPHAIGRHIIGMLDAGRCAQLTVVEQTLVVVSVNPAERQCG